MKNKIEIDLDEVLNELFVVNDLDINIAKNVSFDQLNWSNAIMDILQEKYNLETNLVEMLKNRNIKIS